jgi:hypothetical protein
MFTQSSFSTCKTGKVAIADGQTFSDSIDKKSAGNLNLYNFENVPTAACLLTIIFKV